MGPRRPPRSSPAPRAPSAGTSSRSRRPAAGRSGGSAEPAQPTRAGQQAAAAQQAQIDAQVQAALAAQAAQQAAAAPAPAAAPPVDVTAELQKLAGAQGAGPHRRRRVLRDEGQGPRDLIPDRASEHEHARRAPAVAGALLHPWRGSVGCDDPSTPQPTVGLVADAAGRARAAWPGSCRRCRPRARPGTTCPALYEENTSSLRRSRSRSAMVVDAWPQLAPGVPYSAAMSCLTHEPSPARSSQ